MPGRTEYEAICTLSKPHPPDEVDGLLELGLGLRWEADDDVRRQAGIGHDLPDAVRLL